MRKNRVISFIGNMKISCTCGNETQIAIDKDAIRGEDDFASHANIDCDKFTIVSEHDECWMYCNKCGNSLHLFT